jgi:PilZ domain
MSTACASPPNFPNTRRWPRFHANLPVLISINGDSSRLAVPGLASEISRSGMALYGGVRLEPGELMEVEFQTSHKLRVAGVVRNCSGFCFGLEFVNPLATEEDAANILQGTAASARPQTSLREWIVTRRGDVSLGIASLLLLLAILPWVARSPQNVANQASIQPSLTLWERALVNLGLADAPAPAPFAGNPAARVWVDVHTALYYCPGADLYGKTPDGKFTTQRDAQMDQFEPAARASCQ